MRWLRRAGIAIGVIASVFIVWAAVGAIVYSSEYVIRVLSSGESDVGDYLDGFPLRSLNPSPEPFLYPVDQDEAAVRRAFEPAFGTNDLTAFFEETSTNAFIVIRDGRVIHEGYYNGSDRSSMMTSFSVAKSVDSALIGIAIGEGFVAGVDEPITTYLPELLDRDAGFARITIGDLLSMASGLDYQEMRWWLFNGDDVLTTYHPDQRDIALTNTNIVEPPGQHFNYNKYHPQLLGMILERATRMSVTEYTQTRLWDPLGMEYEGGWALDSTDSGFEKMEAGLNARAIDFAKFGSLYLNGGEWRGVQVVPSDWVVESTSFDPSTHTAEYYSQSFGSYVYDDGQGFYRYMWYGKLREGLPPDIIAEGDRGQIIYISPAHGVVIVRNGTDFGVPLGEWVDAFYRAASDLG